MTIHIESGSIIVGVDGSDDAQRALHWAAEHASRTGRPLALVVAAGIDQVAANWAGPSGAYVVPVEDVMEQMQEVVAEAAESVRGSHPQLSVTTHATHGDPRDVLVDLSRHAHLVVTGSRGRGVLRSRLLGSVSTSVVRHALSPVVVCRPESPGLVRKGVAVGVDGTLEGQAVLEQAFLHASLRGLPLTVLHAFNDALLAVDAPEPGPGEKAFLDHKRLLTAEAVAGFSERFPDVQVDSQLACGLAHEVLAADSQQWNLIVVGRHPTDSWSRMLSSTVATAVVERAHTTVLVVPVPGPS